LAKDAIDRVKQNIRERLEEIESERDQLMRALEALTSGGAPARRRGRPPGSGKGAGRKRGGTSGRRAPRGQRRQQVLDVLNGKELGPSAIAREIGVNPTQISGLLRQLAAEGQVARSDSGKWKLTAPTQSDASAPAQASAEAAAPPQADPAQIH
jgi:predicted Rossmann fold nucleotide-binding protein DprA/Smf involved in DNA uptake